MGALGDEEPTYRVTYTQSGDGRRVTRGADRDLLRGLVDECMRDLRAGRITGLVVTDRFGSDITSDFTG